MKDFLKIKVAFLLLFTASLTYGQSALQFCNGSKGAPVFQENFGGGLRNYGEELPPGTTNYIYKGGGYPDDGYYALFYRTGLIPGNWHESRDHTGDLNGRSLIVNAGFTPGQFYKRTVTGLCANTTFEFSAWVMNILAGGCPGTGIPVNVQFEIWNDTETVLLQSGNTGDIPGTPTAIWRQFGLVFTTTNQTTVVLKMKNNGAGGCGNDLAIDDIVFRACGDLTTISSPSVVGNTYSACQSDGAVSILLKATTVGASSHYYQWQESNDNITFTDIPGANSVTYTTPGVTTQRYYRTKVAQDIVNLSNDFCSALSDTFTVAILASPNPPTSNGDKSICSSSPIPSLSVTPTAGVNVNWYDTATGNNLLLANSNTYTPTIAGTYYAEAKNTVGTCVSTTRTAVKLTIVAEPTATIAGTTAICAGNTATITFEGTPNATVNYTVDGVAKSVALGATGKATVTTPVLTANSTYTLLSVVSAAPASCSKTLSGSAVITVGAAVTATIAGTTAICSGNTATITFEGTPNATVNYTVDGVAASIALGATGKATVTTPNLTANSTYTLVSAVINTPTTCSQTLNASAVITVAPALTATISGTTAICSGNTATISFEGTPNATVNYTVDGVAASIALGATGKTTITTPVLTANSTYTLVSITSNVPTTCSKTLSGSAVISVGPALTATIAGTTAICSGNTATITFEGTPNATVNYTVDGVAASIALGATGKATVTTPNLTANSTYALVSAVINTPTTCSQALSGSAVISVGPALTATISGTTAICSGNTATITFEGTPNATVNYTVDGVAAFIALGATGKATITTPVLTANSTYTLVSIVSNVPTTCSKSLSGSAVISVNARPTATISGNPSICNGNSDLITINGTPNAIVSYTINEGSIQMITIDATGTISFPTSNITATSIYKLLTIKAAGATTCTQSLTDTFTITPIALPTARISGPANICSGNSTTVTITGTPNAVVAYSVNAGTDQNITLNGSGEATILTQNVTADTTYKLTGVGLAGSLNCYQTLSDAITIVVNALPVASFNGDISYCSGETTNIALVSDVVGTTFSWTVAQNGIDGAMAGSGNLISQTLLTSNTATPVYKVTPLNNNCPGTPVDISVTVNPVPLPAITDGVICLDGTTNTALQPYVLNTNLDPQNHNFEWSFNGNLIPTATGSTLIADGLGLYSVVATNTATSCVSKQVDATITEFAKGQNLTITQSNAFSNEPSITVVVKGGQGPFLYQLDNESFQSSNTFYDVTSGNHTITVNDEAGCTNLSTNTFVLNYPRYFTPNGDGVNDTWNIIAPNLNATIYIFDRYGKLLKQIVPDGEGWDGIYNSSNMSADDYWFTIDYTEDGVGKTFKAHFALKR